MDLKGRNFLTLKDYTPEEITYLLDLAAETDSEFDLANNNRAFLLQYFCIAEGTDALGKAGANIALYEALKKYEA